MDWARRAAPTWLGYRAVDAHDADGPTRPPRRRWALAAAATAALLLLGALLLASAAPSPAAVSDSNGDLDADGEAPRESESESDSGRDRDAPGDPDAADSPHDAPSSPAKDAPDFSATVSIPTTTHLPLTPHDPILWDDWGASSRAVDPADHAVRVVMVGSPQALERSTVMLLQCPWNSPSAPQAHARVGACPLHPKCSFNLVPTAHFTSSPHLARADVVMVSTHQCDGCAPGTKSAVELVADDGAVMGKSRAHNRTEEVGPLRRVLVWREASWPYVSGTRQQRFDALMSPHFGLADLYMPPFAELPSWFRTVSAQERRPLSARPNFIAFVSSHCNADSLRDVYLNHLTDFLGPDRVHRYGKCGDREIEPAPLQNAAPRLATYKFVLAMENEFQFGYVSEKLITALALNAVPVYYGSPGVPQITAQPSFVKASDFGSPRDLARFLVALSRDEDRYQAYHAWRWEPDVERAFHEQYLGWLREVVPRPHELGRGGSIGAAEAEHAGNETAAHAYSRAAGGRFSERHAVCCRLCDAAFLKSLRGWGLKSAVDAGVVAREPEYLTSAARNGSHWVKRRPVVPPRWTPGAIATRLFAHGAKGGVASLTRRPVGSVRLP